MSGHPNDPLPLLFPYQRVRTTETSRPIFSLKMTALGLGVLRDLDQATLFANQGADISSASFLNFKHAKVACFRSPRSTDLSWSWRNHDQFQVPSGLPGSLFTQKPVSPLARLFYLRRPCPRRLCAPKPPAAPLDGVQESGRASGKDGAIRAGEQRGSCWILRLSTSAPKGADGGGLGSRWLSEKIASAIDFDSY
jgi:hypothetical protein